MTTDIKKLITYWREEAEHSWSMVPSLFKKKGYPESLFFGHLTLEKILKALVVAKTQAHAPPIHNLVRLAQLADLSLTQEQTEELEECNEFYLAGRYDEDKMDFRKKATLVFTRKNLETIKKLYLWLKKEFQKINSRSV